VSAGRRSRAARSRGLARRGGYARHAAGTVVAALLAWGGAALAADEPGRGQVSLSLQTLSTSGAYTGSGGSTLPESSSEGYSALLEIEYLLGERWSLYLGLPYINKRFTGFPPHNPAFLETPHPEAEFIDDGEYHGGLQDLRLGVAYHTGGPRWEIAPFVRVELPTRDYPHFGSSAIGQNLWRAELGADFAHQLEFSNFYYGVGYSYTFVEQTLGVNVDYHRIPVRLGYFVNPRLSVELFGEGKLGNGTDGQDYCGAFGPTGQCVLLRQDESWYQHDRQIRHNYATVGVSTSYAIGRNHSVSLATWQMVWGQSINRLDYAANVGISQKF
jgi:hypothetical protein